ncbi:hypothetical protein CKO28_19220 [Rhodovibrio sodomensis]|uniref:Flagellar hook-length control protein-like C-terminal domain-containing protein n=1 Tax=Rhodovibrio sodomensis TaxID=1088 RepID=A0ABS1DIP7_9PROT|nr:flagellar hook-length control protein FliK [Rhodovibrio sodomensis]MBK1670168.1 hypothetical protein [Rhodovibrio sodomensis]
MTTPTPIAFEPSAKPAPARRDTGAGDETHSFAETMQAQRAADIRSKASEKAAADAAHDRRSHNPADQAPRKPDTAFAQPLGDATGSASAETGKTAAAGAHAAKGQSQAEGRGRNGEASGHTAEQTKANTAEAVAKAAAASAATSKGKTAESDPRTAQPQPASATKATQAAAQQAVAAAGTARGTTIGGQPVSTVVENAVKGHAGPVNAATAIAAQNAAAEATRSGKAGEASNTTEARAATAAKTAGQGESAEPTAKVLRDILSGDREGGGRRNAQDSSGPRAQRPETRTISHRTGLTGLSPAMRAAAEAVQQQLGGNNGSATATSTGTGESQWTTQVAQQTFRAEGSAAPAGQAAQSFDPVLQNNGPQSAGAGQPGSLATAGKASPTGASGPPAPTAPPAEQVAVQIQRAAAQGQSRVQIRLNPAELGRIDVKLELGDDGHVRAVLAVDKPETLDLMQRDARALERALQAAGLKTDQGSLNFNLRDDNTGQDQNGAGDGRDHTPGTSAHPAGDAPIPAEQLRASLPADGRIDIRV